MNFEHDISEYVSNLKTKNGNPMSEKDKKSIKKTLTTFCERYMPDSIKTWPDEADYDSFCAMFADKPKFIKDNEPRIRNFFVWVNRDKESDNLTDTKATPELFPVDSDTEFLQGSDDADTPMIEQKVSQEISTVRETAQHVTDISIVGETINNIAKRGRKRLDKNGEIRNNKITVYLTDTQNLNFTALCSLKHVKSTADYILSLIMDEIKKNEKALCFFREAEKMIQ